MPMLDIYHLLYFIVRYVIFYLLMFKIFRFGKYTLAKNLKLVILLSSKSIFNKLGAFKRDKNYPENMPFFGAINS